MFNCGIKLKAHWAQCGVLCTQLRVTDSSNGLPFCDVHIYVLASFVFIKTHYSYFKVKAAGTRLFLFSFENV